MTGLILYIIAGSFLYGLGKAAGVPFFFKQGSRANWANFKDFDSFPSDLQVRQYPARRGADVV